MRGITICNIRREGRWSLGARTEKGILDVAAAARAAEVAAPRTTDEVVRGTDTAGLRKLLADEGNERFLVAEREAEF